MTITLPDDLAEAVAEIARLRGDISAEELVMSTIRRVYGKPVPLKPGETVRDRLKGIIGSVDGPATSFSSVDLLTPRPKPEQVNPQ